ncbi:MAG: flagellar hook-basal body complex protein [Desulfovibrio sp.]|nr:flagellar hook-basal body complex protein [Desulfovibrio sp.]
MRAALYIGATGMKALGDGMNVVTNNLANVSTIGYKSQDIQFADIWYAQQANIGDWWKAQQNSCVALGQKGEGVYVDDVRTIFQQGSFESSNTVTDLAINGTGYFQVRDEQGRDFYTRAGDFRCDNEGVLRTPDGLAVMGYRMNADGSQGELAQITLDKSTTMEASATTSLSMRFNVGQSVDYSSSESNPYFSLLQHYTAGATPPLADTTHGYSESLTLYDATGAAREATIYFDGAPSQGHEGSVVEYVITTDSGENGAAVPVMAGTLSFNANGQLQDMSAYTPNGTGLNDQGFVDLSAWSAAPLSSDGLPLMNAFDSTISVDLGVHATGEWSGSGTAADVGTNAQSLLSMGNSAVVSVDATTNYVAETPVTYQFSQNGYPEGQLNGINITADGKVVGSFSNSENQDLWQIPVCRFTSEYNLRREGNNLFSSTPDCGQMVMGVAGTENFGKIASYNIEQSNVDMAAEMVDMIITQRGFQSNSKVVTTADEMLKKAMELKR